MSATAYKSLVRHAIGQGLFITIEQGGTVQIRNTQNAAEISKWVDGCDEPTVLHFSCRLTPDGPGTAIFEREGWAMVAPAGDLEPDETVIDYLANRTMEDLVAGRPLQFPLTRDAA
jgi:hypothetical protein